MSARAAESLIPLALPAALAEEIARIAGEADAELASLLTTVSLWRPSAGNVVRLFSSRPELYAVGGVADHADEVFVRETIHGGRSFLTPAGEDTDTEAFANRELLREFGFACSINAVVPGPEIALGTLNLMAARDGFTPDSLAAAERHAARLAPALAAAARVVVG